MECLSSFYLMQRNMQILALFHPVDFLVNVCIWAIKSWGHCESDLSDMLSSGGHKECFPLCCCSHADARATRTISREVMVRLLRLLSRQVRRQSCVLSGPCIKTPRMATHPEHGPQRAHSRGRVRGNAHLPSTPAESPSVTAAGLQRGPCPGCWGGGQGDHHCCEAKVR